MILSVTYLKSQEVINSCNYMQAYGDSVVRILSGADTTGVGPGNSGANVIWDFSSLVADTIYEDFHMFVDPASTPCFSDYDTSNYVSQCSPEVNTRYVYSLRTPEAMICYGYCDMPAGCGEINWNIQIDQKCPFVYQDSYPDTVWGYKCSGSPSVYIHFYKLRQTTYDAYGTLALPGEKSYNALRLKTTEQRIDSMFLSTGIFMSQTITNTTTYFWANADEQDPEKSLLLLIVSGDVMGNKFKQVTYLDTIFGITTGVHINNPVYAFSINPNPFSKTTEIKFDSELLSQNPVFYMYDYTGKEVKKITTIKSNSITIDRNNLHNGMYFFNVMNYDGMILRSGKLMIE